MNPNTLVKTKSRICFTFHKSQHPFPKFSFSTSNIFFFLFSKLNCRYLWNIHWEIMDFIHPMFNQTWVSLVVQPWPGPWGSEWVEESEDDISLVWWEKKRWSRGEREKWVVSLELSSGLVPVTAWWYSDMMEGRVF